MFVMALADGAGSASKSHDGARQAVISAIKVLANALRRGPPSASKWKRLMCRAFYSARSALEDLADGAPLRDYATTLTCAAACPDHLVIAQIGDAIVGASLPSKEMRTYMQPQRTGEYANQTCFLTDESALDRVRIEHHEISVNAVFAATDGLLSISTHRHGEPYRPFWEPIIRRVAHDADTAPGDLTSLLQSERICARVDDDKTLVVATRADLPDDVSAGANSLPQEPTDVRGPDQDDTACSQSDSAERDGPGESTVCASEREPWTAFSMIGRLFHALWRATTAAFVRSASPSQGHGTDSDHGVGPGDPSPPPRSGQTERHKCP